MLVVQKGYIDVNCIYLVKIYSLLFVKFFETLCLHHILTKHEDQIFFTCMDFNIVLLIIFVNDLLAYQAFTITPHLTVAVVPSS
jgi:hypothetical protein